MFLSRLFAVSMAVLLSVSAALPVFAATDVNIDYEGEIDPITGEPVTEEKTANNQIVTMMTGVSYDRKKQKYLYSVPNSTETISCSVADGMVTTDKVLLSVPSGIHAEPDLVDAVTIICNVIQKAAVIIHVKNQKVNPRGAVSMR